MPLVTNSLPLKSGEEAISRDNESEGIKVWKLMKEGGMWLFALYMEMCLILNLYA